MNQKKLKIINILLVFLLAFPFHFIYEKLPNPITATLFPVNESIWEHMKLLFTGFLVSGIIESFIMKHYHYKVDNFIFRTTIGAILSIPIYLIMFLPVYYKFGEIMWLTLLIMLLAIIITVQIKFNLPLKGEQPALSYFSIVGIIFIYGVFLLLTLYPPHTHFFFDTMSETYGINDTKRND